MLETRRRTELPKTINEVDKVAKQVLTSLYEVAHRHGVAQSTATSENSVIIHKSVVVNSINDNKPYIIFIIYNDQEIGKKSLVISDFRPTSNMERFLVFNETEFFESSKTRIDQYREEDKGHPLSFPLSQREQIALLIDVCQGEVDENATSRLTDQDSEILTRI